MSSDEEVLNDIEVEKDIKEEIEEDLDNEELNQKKLVLWKDTIMMRSDEDNKDEEE